MSTPEQTAAAVRALAREVDTLRTAVDDLDAVKASTAATDRAVVNLSEVVTGLADRLREMAAGGGPETRSAAPRPYWMTVADPDLAEAMLAGLIDWVATVYLRFPKATLTECWTLHEAVVAELMALQEAWLEALDGEKGSAARVVDWHERSRPGVVERVAGELQDCGGLSRHMANQPFSYRPPRAPGGQMAGEVARWWAASHGATAAPTPTQEMLMEERTRQDEERSSTY